MRNLEKIRDRELARIDSEEMSDEDREEARDNCERAYWRAYDQREEEDKDRRRGLEP